MIQQHIDRSRQTTGGMTASIVLHVALLTVLTVAAGAHVVSENMDQELTEIAYIEARYGEDVAAKVKLKEPPGRGVATDSARRPAEPESPAPPRPEPKPATRTERPRTEPVQRQRAAVAEIVAPAIQPAVQPQQTLAQAQALETKAPRPRSRQVIDASRLQGNLNVKIAENTGAPLRSSERPRGQFKPQAGALQSKAGGIVAGSDVVAAAGSSRTRGVAEAPTTVAAGGALQGNSRGDYAAPGSALAPVGEGGGKPGGKGVLDVSGPTGGGGREGGRKTILDYGSGSGGRGGGLAGRGRLAEPEPTAIVDKKAAAAEPKQAVAEVKLDGKGVGMTISGQISGRKILKSVQAQYTTQARRKGWEGVVAVHFTVLADGRVKDNTYFEQSSVHRDLNQAALDAIKKFRFAPLPSENAAVEQWGIITIVFRLN
ncbi:MAG: energy transducer TonB [bacterium]|nr:energy transducer TonB [bacterium]